MKKALMKIANGKIGGGGRGLVHLTGKSRILVSGLQMILSTFPPSFLLFLSQFILAFLSSVSFCMQLVKIAPKKTLSHHESRDAAEFVIRKSGRKTFGAAKKQ